MQRFEYTSWSNFFQDEKYRYMIKSKSIVIPSEFATYLTNNSEGIIIPENLAVTAFCSSKESRILIPSADPLQEFNVAIEQIIKELGGKVFVKLNWSAPTVIGNYGNILISCTTIITIIVSRFLGLKMGK